MEYWTMVPGARLTPSAALYNPDGILLLTTAPFEEPVWHGKPFDAALYRSRFVIPGDILNDGLHEIHLSFIRDGSVCVHTFGCLGRFEIKDDAELRRGWNGKWTGAVRPRIPWATEQVRPLS